MFRYSKLIMTEIHISSTANCIPSRGIEMKINTWAASGPGPARLVSTYHGVFHVREVVLSHAKEELNRGHRLSLIYMCAEPFQVFFCGQFEVIFLPEQSIAICCFLDFFLPNLD